MQLPKREILSAVEESGCSSERVRGIEEEEIANSRDVYRVEIEGSDNLYVYFCVEEEYSDRFMREETVVESVKEIDGVKSQRILHSDFTEKEVPHMFYVAEEEEGVSGGKAVRELEPWHRNRVLTELGRMIGRIHEKRSFESSGHLEPRPDELEVKPGSSWADIVHSDVRDQLEHLKEGPFSDLHQKSSRLLETNLEILEPGENVLLHNDITPSNMVFGNNGVEALLDWEASCVGDPIWDLVHVEIRVLSRWIDTQRVHETPADLLNHLRRGYESVRESYRWSPQRAQYYRFLNTVWVISGWEIENWQMGWDDGEEQYFRNTYRKRFENRAKELERLTS